mmetsp:Transcript_87213/g.244728  ORF Transcript_87213/g.244728 Transcript_87213/m.244728 type:complete len:200 (+) Transcript_87213:202-801(+)
MLTQGEPLHPNFQAPDGLPLPDLELVGGTSLLGGIENLATLCEGARALDGDPVAMLGERGIVPWADTLDFDGLRHTATRRHSTVARHKRSHDDNIPPSERVVEIQFDRSLVQACDRRLAALYRYDVAHLQRRFVGRQVLFDGLAFIEHDPIIPSFELTAPTERELLALPDPHAAHAFVHCKGNVGVVTNNEFNESCIKP